MRNCVLGIAVIFVVASCSSFPIDNQQHLLSEPPFSSSNADSFWATIPVDQTPISRRALLKLLSLSKSTGADSLLVIWNNRIVSEWYSEQYFEPLPAMSTTKGIAALLVGIASDSGFLRIEEPVSKYLQDWIGKNREEVTIESILNHTSGIKSDIGKRIPITNNESLTDYSLRLYPEQLPGSRYDYSNFAYQLLDPVIRSATGTETEVFAQRKLFAPLGMNNTSLKMYLGKPWMYAEMQTTARDLGRIGLLMLNRGRWNDQSIVSEGFVRSATTSSKLNPLMGLGWWILDSKKTVNGFYTSGSQNTDIYVFPEFNLVIVRTQYPKGGNPSRNESKGFSSLAQEIFKEIGVK